MKKKNLLLYLGILTFIFIGSITTVIASGISDVKITDDTIYLENNWDKVLLADKIQNIITNHYNIKDHYNDLYPAYYGGMYINDDATNLVIQIVKKYIPDKGSEDYFVYDRIISMDDSIKIEYVDNSYNELNSANNRISDFMSSNTSDSKNIISSSINVINNKVDVGLLVNGDSQQSKLKSKVFTGGENIDLDIINFSEEDYSRPSTNLYVGGSIGNGCSMGFRVRYNGKNGFVTAGHCARNNVNFFTGTAKVWQFANNQYYDYAFVETNTSYIPLNNLAFSMDNVKTLGVYNTCPTITANMQIAHVGKTSGYRKGKVKKLNQTIKYKMDDNSTITIKGLITSDVFQEAGDSGGAVFIPRTDADGGAVAIGILSGGINHENAMYFTSINDLPRSLQTRY